MPKIKYYSVDKISNTDCEYNIILGKRSNGKSYAVKNMCIKKAWDNPRERFILLRRLAEEIKPSCIVHYFTDVPITQISNGLADNIIIYRGEIWACKYSDVDDKNKKIRLLGYVRALIKAPQYKSGDYTDVTDIIYEEFIAEVGARYLPAEPQALQSFVSTVARLNKIRVWLIGNTISRLCPYFTEWGLKNIPKQEPGTIDFYTVNTDGGDIKIAVEVCSDNNAHGKMFFGNTAKMINNGAWQTSKQYPVLSKPLADYKCVYTMVVAGFGFCFLGRLLRDGKNYCWYFVPKTTPIQPKTRVITNVFSPDLLYTKGFAPLNKGERTAFDFIQQDKICFSDSLTAEDFYSVLKNLNTL